MNLFGRAQRAALVLSLAAGAHAQVVYFPLGGSQLEMERAGSINCVNNLHNLGLAAQRWSATNGNRLPPDFQSFTNQLDSPGVLFCPADVGTLVVTNWAQLDWSQVDYTWFAQPSGADPSAVLCQCRLHENYLRVDGTVQNGGYRSGWPVVIASPIEQAAVPGSDIEFGVRIAPDALQPVSYQWRREQLYFVTNAIFIADPSAPGGGYWQTNRQGRFNVTLLSGETNAAYVIAKAQTNASDFYSVACSNSLGTVVSARARLTVDPSVSNHTEAYSASVTCLNNLKQIFLCGGIWANDHNSQMPTSLSVMTNAYGVPMFGWPLQLFCRADTNRIAPPDWPGLNLDDTSYEVLPGNPENPYDVFCRCKVHGYYVQMDGEVVQQPSFEGIRWLDNHTAELTFAVFAGKTNSLEASTDLLNWTAVTSYAPTNGSFAFYDTNQLARRFYRLRAQ